MLQAALFGKNKIFATNTGNSSFIEKDSLIIQQDNGVRSVRLDPQGGIVIRLNLDQSTIGLAVIKEKLEQQIIKALHYADWVLDKIDSTQRLTHVAIAATLSDFSSTIIRTQAENDANPNSYSMPGFGSRKSEPVHLKPPHRTRAALKLEADKLAEDFVTLLRRGSSS